MWFIIKWSKYDIHLLLNCKHEHTRASVFRSVHACRTGTLVMSSCVGACVNTVVDTFTLVDI